MVINLLINLVSNTRSPNQCNTNIRLRYNNACDCKPKLTQFESSRRFGEKKKTKTKKKGESAGNVEIGTRKKCLAVGVACIAIF